MLGEGTGNNYAYLVTDDKTKDAVIVDPANPSEYEPMKRQDTIEFDFVSGSCLH